MTARAHFRLDIQGLRAIAVLSVIAFHADLPLPGGFIGVDVFFVISGFVITQLLQREWAKNRRINLLQFWKRRFFRLFPALALVVFFAILGSGLLQYPDEQTVTIQTGLAGLLMSANIMIARNTGGYFDLPAATNPLLNIWSLSVEEQFYVIFPLVLILGWVIARKFSARNWINLLLVGTLIIGSFMLAVLATQTSDGSAIPTWLNFYSPMTRVWEFGVGALIALASSHLVLSNTGSSRALRFVGLTLLALSFFLISPTTPWPGSWTLLPVIATALVIVAGNNTSHLQSRLLSNRVSVSLGDWSYSLYLWHWPFVVFALTLGFDSTWELVVAVTLSFIPALLSYKFVEQPVRKLSQQKLKPNLRKIGLIIALPIGASILTLTVLTPQVIYSQDIGTSYLNFIEANSYPCTLDIPQDPLGRCRQSQENSIPTIAVVGDSHAEHLFPGMLQNFPDVNTQYIYLPNWPYSQSKIQDEAIAGIANSPSIQTVLLSASWDAETTSYAEYLEKQVTLLTGAGKNVVLVQDVPTFSFSSRQCKYKLVLNFQNQCEEYLPNQAVRARATVSLFNEIAQGNDLARVAVLPDWKCRNDCCSMVKNDVLMYSDHGHLTVEGSRKVVEEMSQIIANRP
jgi:peptidoglycan/LPS O-acetylase OafA/YrhL